MCGIVGLILTEGLADANLIKQMNDTLTHRGPDDEGYFVEKNVGLGMRRLSIIDLRGGRQPILNEDGSVVVVFNGEIYNYKELRTFLEKRGHVFCTRSDTETLVHGYEEWGVDLSTHLIGMFAYAIYDRKKRQLLLARDHLGIKPLYYARLNMGGIAFASELKALRLVDGWSQRINLTAVDQFLAMRYIPSPLTIYEGALKLPPAHWMLFKDKDMRIEPFWSLKPIIASDISALKVVDEIKAIVSDSVKRQMLADVPLGVFLSGGLDSSIIAALMTETANEPVRSFTVIFPNWPDLNEAPHARQVADHIGATHEEIQVEAKLPEAFVDTVRVFDEPFADPAAVPTLLMAQAARHYVKVVLTGEGADELFAGYPHYDWYKPLIGKVISPMQPLLQKVLWGRKGFRFVSIASAPNFQNAYFDGILVLTHLSRDLRKQLFQEATAQELCERNWRSSLTSFPENHHVVSKMQYLDTKIWLEGDPLVKVDRTTMAASLEARVPFLDHRLVECALSLPPQYHRRNGDGKLVLRSAFASKLPISIIGRSKHAFEVPINDWLRGSLKSLLIDTLLTNQLPWFRKEVLHEWVYLHLSGRQLGCVLWTLLSLGIWYNEVYRSRG